MNLPTTIQEEVNQYVRASHSEATRRAYRSDCRIFAHWCSARKLTAFPAAPGTVSAFIADQARSCTAATISRRLAAIARVHHAKQWPSPIDDSVKRVLAGVRRKLGAAPHPKAPLVASDIQKIIDHLNAADSSNELLDCRDRALILVGWFGAMRRSELAALCFEDVEFKPKGAVLTIRRSKTDQEALGQQIALIRASNAALDPVYALRRWMAVSGLSSGPLFRSFAGGKPTNEPLSTNFIARIVKRRASLAGLDSSKISAHSLRSGALTSGALAGANLHKLKELSRHKNLSTLSRYIRAVEMFDDHALEKVGL